VRERSYLGCAVPPGFVALARSASFSRGLYDPAIEPLADNECGTSISTWPR
jgi:hypothetical protein